MSGRFNNLSELLPVLLAALCLAGGAVAEEYKVETADSPAPEELAPAVRESLSQEAVRVVGPQGPLCDIWMRQPIPLQAGGGMQLGIVYTQFQPGTLVGAIRFHGEVTGYRKQRVQPGVYTLRYALHPVDGDHMGVAPQRDFLLLAPAAADLNLEVMGFDELVELSRQATGTRHPSVWSLAEPEEDPDTFPAIVHWEEENLWFLYLQAQAQTEGGPPAELLLALVIIGHAPEA